MNADALLRAVLRAARGRRIADGLLMLLPLLVVAVATAWRLSGVGAAMWVLVAGAAAFATLVRLRVRVFDIRWLAHALNGHRVDMDDSAGLLFADTSTLTGLEQLQARRLRQRLQSAPAPDLRPPWSIRAVAVSVAFASITLPVLLLWPAHTPTSLAEVVSRVGFNRAAPTHTRLLQQQLLITPPAYTRQPTRQQATLDARAPQGSGLQWRIRFDPQPRAAALVLHDGRRVPLQQQGADWGARHVLDKSALYRIVLDDAPPLQAQRLHRLDAVSDRPPQVRVLQPDQSLSLVRAGQQRWTVAFEANDDYAIAAAAQLRVSLAQGGGEDISVRELTLPLQGRGTTARKRYTRQLDLTALGLAPGDDLIVQLIVRDNRAPAPQQARSPSLILRWPPPRGDESTGLEGMVSKVLPAYFRSQRQIIIDAEALLAQQRWLDAPRYLKRADEIGVDQRILRLRYGEFLGEESDGAPQLPTNDAEPAQVGTDEHDGGDQGQAATQDLHAVEHVAASGSPTFGREPDITEISGHDHDLPEAATLLDPETRTILKAALDQMWQSELHLRQGHPEQSLPYANAALRYIKQVQQASRIYLARVGTQELPSIDESRRLSGDRAGLARRGDALVAANDTDPVLTGLWQSLDAVPPQDRGASPAIDVNALERWLGTHQEGLADPLAFVAAIEALRRDQTCVACRRNLRTLLWPLLARPPVAVPRRADADASGRRYLDALQQERAP